MTLGCFVIFGIVFQKIRIYEKYQSALDKVAPFRAPFVGLDKNKQALIDQSRCNYMNAHGKIQTRFLIYKNKSNYNSRYFKDMLEKGLKTVSKKRKILLTICLSLLIFVSFAIPFTISYCFADYDDEQDYQINVSTFVDVRTMGSNYDSFFNNIYTAHTVYPTFGDTVRYQEGAFISDITYQYDVRLNNIITFAYTSGGITNIQLSFTDFVYNFNNSTSIFGSLYVENALYVQPNLIAYDINSGHFDLVELDLLTSNDGWYSLDFNISQNFRNSDGFTYIQNLTIDIAYASPVVSRTVEFDIVPNLGYTINDFFNSLKTVERIEYQLNFFDSLAQSVDRIMLIEIFPGISFYSLLSVVIAVPIFIAILKLWLGG